MHKWCFLFAASAILLACSSSEDKIRPNLQPITESVYSSVTIQPDSLYKAYASVGGLLETNFIEEGSSVTKGMALMQVINSNPKINAENARLSLELAKKNFSGRSALLSSIEDEIKAARLTLLNDSVNYCRQRNLWEQGIGSKIEYDTKKLAYELSGNKVSLLEAKYEQSKNELQTQLQQAENNYTASLITTGDFTVESKIDGKVYAIYKNPGEIVNTMEPLALVGSATDFVIELLVDEVDIVKLQRRQQVLVTLDAYNGQVFTAKVDKIFPKKDERNQTFLVEALFDEQPDVLYPGLAGEANILIDQKKEALIIPKQFLINGNRVKTDDGIVEVELGLQSMDSVEVINGITSETWIYKPND